MLRNRVERTYNVVDAGTVVAGEPPCGPITYDYGYDGKRAIRGRRGRVPSGRTTVPLDQLFAQVTIYQSAAFTRVVLAARGEARRRA